MRYYAHTTAMLALIVILCTVAPASSLAVSTTHITNSVSAESNTGGISLDGADGENGEDGKDGKDGKDAQSAASVSIMSSINGTNVTDLKETVVEGDIPLKSETHITESDLASPSDELSPEERSAIQKLLSSIQVMLLQYVSLLF